MKITTAAIVLTCLATPAQAFGMLMTCHGNPIYGIVTLDSCNEYGKYLESGKGPKDIEGISCYKGFSGAIVFQKQKEGRSTVFDEVAAQLETKEARIAFKNKQCADLMDTMDFCEDGGCKDENPSQ